LIVASRIVMVAAGEGDAGAGAGAYSAASGVPGLTA
jgi:hypothetical protein